MKACCRFITALLINPLLLAAQPDLTGCHKSTEGTDFWFGFMEGRNYNPTHSLEISVSTRETCNFRINIGPKSIPLNSVYTAQANQTVRIAIPDWKIAEATGSEKIQDFGIHLVAEKPVNVYALNWDQNSNDVAVIYPVESLGNEYFAMCYTPSVSVDEYGSYLDGRNSEFLIVAAYDSTHVEITPSVVTDKLRPAGIPFSVLLNKGQVYQVQSKNEIYDQPGQGDLTGSYISSDKPVAFYSGSLSAKVPSVSKGFWDHLYEQVPPLHSWGREFYTIPLKMREHDRFRVLASEDETKVSINGFRSVKLNRGEFYEFVLRNFQPKKILADKPVLVAQYSLSREEDHNYTGSNLEPFLVFLSPVSQLRNDILFSVYEYGQQMNNFINIIAPTPDVPKILLNGQSIGDKFIPHTTGEYSFAQIELEKGVYHLEDSNKNGGVFAYAYGYGSDKSFGYGVGFNLDPELDLGGSLSFEGDTLVLCHGENKILDAGPGFDKYLWNTGDTTRKLAVPEGGWYSVIATYNKTCMLNDSVFLLMSHPQTDLGIDKYSCPPFSTLLDAGPGFESYSWSTGDSVQQITADKTGTYSVAVSDIYSCLAYDTLNLTIFPVPEIEIDGQMQNCGILVTNLTAIVSGVDPDLWNLPGNIKWGTQQPGQLIFYTPEKTATQVEATGWGEYNGTFRLTTINGCETGRDFTIRFFGSPTSDFRFADDAPGEKCAGYSREVLYTGNATEAGTFFWDFEGSKVTDTLGWQNFRISLGANTLSSVSLMVEEDGCRSEIQKKPIGILPEFQISADRGKGCDSLTVQFSGNFIAGEPVVYEWEFGDGTSSSVQNPKHSYPNPGIYNVGLTVTNKISQCKSAFTASSMVKVYPTPIARFYADSVLCYPDSIRLVYPDYNDSSVCSWFFQGAHALTNQNDSVWAFIESPVAKVTLSVEEHGCTSPPVSKTVKRMPRFDFEPDSENRCQPVILKIIPKSEDALLEYSWTRESMKYYSAEKKIFSFPDTGRYSIGMTAYSPQTQCKRTLIKPGWIHVLQTPEAGFSSDFSVATSQHSEINFTNLSKEADFYFWNFGDGIFSEIINPSHYYNEPGIYTTRLIASSSSGCSDTVSASITIVPFRFVAPNAFRPESDIPENRVFLPIGIGANPSQVKVQIYNRWGQLVFISAHPDNKWDGKLPDGKPAPAGNYIWTAIYTDVQGYEHHQKGQVFLLR